MVRKKLVDLIKVIRYAYYVGWNNFRIGNFFTNDVVFFSIATAVLGKNLLEIGDYGVGKTSLAELVGCLVYGVPLKMMESSKITGHSQQTEEKIIGRPHLGKLMQGTEQVQLSFFVLNYPSVKIVDEISRLTEGEQNLLIHSIDRGEFSYLNTFINYNLIKLPGGIKLGKPPFIATTNYDDIGMGRIVEAILDRFHMSVEVTPPLGLEYYITRVKENRDALYNPDLYEEAKKIFTDEKLEIEEKINEYAKVREKYRKHLSALTIGAMKIPILTDRDILVLRKEISNIKITEEAWAYILTFLGKVNAIPVKNLKRNDAKFRDSISGIITVNLGPRIMFSLISYSQFLAYIMGKREVDIPIVKLLLPYALMHRTLLRSGIEPQKLAQIVSGLKHNQRSYMMVMKKIVEIFDREFNTNRHYYITIYRKIIQRDFHSLEVILKNYSGDDLLINTLKEKVLYEG